MSIPSPWTRSAFRAHFRSLSWLAPISLFFLFLQLSGIYAAAQSTDFAIGTTVKQSGAKRLGINLANQDYWDSGQMLRDITFRNPGFEAETWASTLKCVAVTTTTCTDQNPWNVWPANFLAAATFQVVNGAAAGETGTITSDTGSDYELTGNQSPTYGITITYSALSTPLAVGDYLIVRTQIPGNAQAGWWTSTSGGATLSTDTTDLAPDTPGKQALDINASSSGQSATVSEYFDSSSGRSFLQLNGSYTVAFKAKSLGGSGQINVLVTRENGATYLNQNVTLTSSWQDYSYTFNASENGSAIGTAQLTFSINGANVLLDDASVTEAAAADNPTAFRNAVVDRLKTLHPGVIRYMDPTDFGTSIANVVAVPYARQRAGYSSQQSEEDDVPMGLEEFLVLCQTVGAEPWYSMPGTATTQDMQNLIEFLGGSSSTPYGAIRASLGQSAPWTSVFPIIHIELGNEIWNTANAGMTINDPVIYGNRASQIFAAAKASASYTPGSFDLIMGSWANNAWYTQQELANATNYDSVDGAPYLYYTLSDYSSNEAIFGPMFAQPEQIDSNSSGYMYQQQQAVAAANPPANFEVYEVNLSTISGTAPQNVLTQAVAGVGAGITVADHMLTMMRDDGVTTQNMFALTEYGNGFTNTAGGSETTPLWGSTIDMGGETNLNRPQFLAEELANTAIMPTLLATTVTGANPTWNQALSANDTTQPIQLANAHYLQSFAFTDGTNYSAIVFNLSRSGSLPITFSGTNAPTGNVLISQLTSANITDNNESNNSVVNITQTNQSNFQPSTAYSLPPFSMTVFSWPNSSLPATTTALTASPTQGSTGQAVTLTATVTSQSGTATPTGTVTFLNGSTSIGTATLDSNGVAILGTSSLPAGSDSITASYGGDSKNAGSVSPAVMVTLTSNLVATTTALTASATQINSGQSVSFTATVSPASGSAIPTGTVTFLNGSTTLGSAALSASGVATLNTSSLPAGSDAITASYGGSTSNSSSVSSAIVVNVAQSTVSTTTALAASATQIRSGQNVIFTATVSPASGSTAPTGTVTFLDGTKTLGTATLSGGRASFSSSTLANGSHSITASYGGTAGDTASVSTAVTVNVSQGAAATTTTLTASATQINTGQTVSFTAHVAAQSGSTTPGGSVSFLNGSTILGSATLNSSGAATFSTSALPAGTDSIAASYSGNNSFDSSVSPAVAVKVNQTSVATTTTLTASATQIDAGQTVSFTAHVAAQSESTTPSGSVSFSNGSTILGSATLNSSGAATFSTSALPAGTDSITASYGGGSGDSASVSTAVAVTVGANQAAAAAEPTSTKLAASSSQVNQGQSVSFTATVAKKSGSGAPSGVVTFLEGQTALGTATLNGSGIASFSTSSLAQGSDSVTASYGGDANDASSTSAPVTVTVAATSAASPSYTMAVSSSNVTVTQGEVANLTVTVSPQNGFDAPVDLSCSGMPAGTSCSFSPTTVTPSGKPVSSTLSILSSGSSATAQNRPADGPSKGRMALGLVMPWGILSLLGLSRRRNRSRMRVWSGRIVVAAALIAGSLWMSGCGYSVNTSVFTMTVTSSGKNVPTQTSQITVNIAQ